MSLRSFFWKVYGIEKELISDCETDYNFYLGQGLVLFMTSLFACFSGCMAGYEYSFETVNINGVEHVEVSWITVILCGLVWGALIYSIDRVMVSTIDKISLSLITSKWNRFLTSVFKYFLPRAILATVLAAAMSTPIKFRIFKDQIEEQAINNDLTFAKQGKDTIRSIYYVTEKEEQATKADSNVSSLFARTNEEDPQSPALRDEVKNLEGQLKAARSINCNDRSDDKAIQDCKKRKLFQIRNLNRQINRLKSEIDTLNITHRTQIKRLLQSASDIRDTAAVALKQANQKSANAGEKIDKKLSKKKFGIDSKLKALYGNKDGWIRFFAWFIMATFFIIEILPTFLKLIGKPRAYDWKSYYHEQMRIETFRLKYENDVDIFRQVEEYRIREQVKEGKYKVITNL